MKKLSKTEQNPPKKNENEKVVWRKGSLYCNNSKIYLCLHGGDNAEKQALFVNLNFKPSHMKKGELSSKDVKNVNQSLINKIRSSGISLPKNFNEVTFSKEYINKIDVSFKEIKINDSPLRMNRLEVKHIRKAYVANTLRQLRKLNFLLNLLF